MENLMNRIGFLKLWSVMVGGMDAVTGLLLILIPSMVLRLLGVAPPSTDALLFLSWIGVFVMAVGLSYAMALGNRCRGETVWAFTAMVRIMVAAFIVSRIVGGSMPPQWVLVAVSDGVVGIAQLVLIRAGWWREVGK
jgi:hypothetical protein